MIAVRADVQQLRERVLLLEAREKALTTLLQTKNLITNEEISVLQRAVESHLRQEEQRRILVRPRQREVGAP